ncbi:MAG TPA: CvpA family protein [Caulobacteraceae bacterium]|nr:CvpA family protein [Caulobacteraceae bacterium]
MTGFDILAGAILLVSGLIGFARGATRELVTLTAFVAGVAIAIFGLRFSAPIAGHFIHILWLARVAALVIVFVAVYIAVRLAGGALNRGVRRTALSGLDRALGFAIGFARGAVVVAIIALAIRAATPRERMPHWYTQALIYPEASAGAQALRALAPKGMAFMRRAAPVVENAMTDENTVTGNDSTDPQADQNQRPKTRKGMHVLVEKPRP